MERIAIIPGDRAVLQVAHAHAPSALATQDQALQERCALAHRPRAVFRAKGAIVVQVLLVAEELIPCDIGRMLLMEHNGPVLAGHTTGAALHPRGFAGEEARPSLGPTIHVRPGIGGIIQHLEDARVRQGFPVEFVALAFPPPAGGEPVG